MDTKQVLAKAFDLLAEDLAGLFGVLVDSGMLRGDDVEEAAELAGDTSLAEANRAAMELRVLIKEHREELLTELAPEIQALREHGNDPSRTPVSATRFGQLRLVLASMISDSLS